MRKLQRRSSTAKEALLRILVVASCVIQPTKCFVVGPRNSGSLYRQCRPRVPTTPTLFSPPHKFSSAASLRTIMMASSMANILKRRNVRLPLLDLINSDYSTAIVTPLPSAHLPQEITTLNLYGMELDRAIHKMLMEDAVQKSSGGEKERAYGHIVWKPHPSQDQGEDFDSDSDFVGAIGCAAEILMCAPKTDGDSSDESNDNSNAIRILCRGSYRFVVKEVLKTFPYPIAIVDELLDDPSEPVATIENVASSDDDEGEEDDVDFYSEMDASEMVRRTLAAMQGLVDQKMESRPNNLSPLEKMILESSGIPVEESVQNIRDQVEEMAAVFDVFRSSLIDIAPLQVDRYYAIAMLAAEMANIKNSARSEILIMTNGTERLRVVLREIEEIVGMERARKMANQITDEEPDEESKDLQVGTPQLPPWARKIKTGTKVEYYWNEEWEWCAGVVIEDPVTIIDEIILVVRFADGEVHRLPIQADEKARWRPV